MICTPLPKLATSETVAPFTTGETIVSKKHYVAIAAILANCLKQENTPEGRLAVKNAARELANEFAGENPGFQRSRFLQACGIEQS